MKMIYHSIYGPTEDNPTVMEVLSSGSLLMKLSANERTRQAGTHVMGEVTRLSAFQFESDGRMLLSIVARTTDGALADLIMPRVDLDDFIAQLQNIQNTLSEAEVTA